VTDTTAVSKRVAEGMAASEDKTVRGWGCGELVRLDRFNADNMNAVAAMLKDSDDWVRSNAVGCIASFGKKAAFHLPALREFLKSPDANLRSRAEKSIDAIEKFPDAGDDEIAYAAAQKKIAEFIGAWAKRVGK
jgi:hypothetical protein